jgi:RNA polymerase sigma-70 factor (ECF subfamily)
MGSPAHRRSLPSPRTDRASTVPETTRDPLSESLDRDDVPDLTESMQLVVQAQAGDEQALDDLLRRYQGRLQRIVRIRLNTKLRRCVESTDIVQETCRSAALKIGTLKLRSTASILQWLSRIAENEMIDVHRRFYGTKRDRAREVRIAEGGGEHGVVPLSEGASPDELASQREIRAIVDDAVARLPDDDREVILLRSYYGGSWEFVARELGRPNAEATRQLHRRARIRLGRMLRSRLSDLI